MRSGLKQSSMSLLTTHATLSLSHPQRKKRLHDLPTLPLHIVMFFLDTDSLACFAQTSKYYFSEDAVKLCLVMPLRCLRKKASSYSLLNEAIMLLPPLQQLRYYTTPHQIVLMGGLGGEGGESDATTRCEVIDIRRQAPTSTTSSSSSRGTMTTFPRWFTSAIR